jgi:hypothetical protein
MAEIENCEICKSSRPIIWLPPIYLPPTLIPPNDPPGGFPPVVSPLDDFLPGSLPPGGLPPGGLPPGDSSPDSWMFGRPRRRYHHQWVWPRDKRYQDKWSRTKDILSRKGPGIYIGASDDKLHPTRQEWSNWPLGVPQIYGDERDRWIQTEPDNHRNLRYDFSKRRYTRKPGKNALWDGGEWAPFLPYWESRHGPYDGPMGPLGGVLGPDPAGLFPWGDSGPLAYERPSRYQYQQFPPWEYSSGMQATQAREGVRRNI